MTQAGTRAIILAAGRGSRLGHLTDNNPKCLVKLGGRALIELQMEALRGGGAGHIAIVGGYRAEMLRFPKVETFTNVRWQSTEMVSSLLCARSWLEHFPCLVSYADIFYPASIAAELRRRGHDLAVAYDPHWLSLWSARFPDPLSDAETFAMHADGTLKEIGGKATDAEAIEGQYMGLLHFTPAGWNIVARHLDMLPQQAVERLSMTALLARLIAEGTEIHAVPVEGQWGEVDSIDDLALYEAAPDAAAPWRLPR